MRNEKEVAKQTDEMNETQREVIQLTGQRSVRIKSADWPVIVNEVIPIFKILDPDKNGDLSATELLQLSAEDATQKIKRVTVEEDICFSIRRHNDGRSILEIYQPGLVNNFVSQPYTMSDSGEIVYGLNEIPAPYTKIFIGGTYVSPEKDISIEIEKLLEESTRKFGGCRPEDFEFILNRLTSLYKAKEVGIVQAAYQSAYYYGFSGWRTDFADHEYDEITREMKITPPKKCPKNPFITFMTMDGDFVRVSIETYSPLDSSSDKSMCIFKNANGEALVLGRSCHRTPQSVGMNAYIYDTPLGVFLPDDDSKVERIIDAVQQISEKLKLDGAAANELIGRRPPIDLE